MSNLIAALPKLPDLQTLITAFPKLPDLPQLLPEALYNTVIMTVSTSLIALLIGLPLGLILVLTAKDGLMEDKLINKTLGFIVDTFRAVPFIVLAASLGPVTSFVIGRRYGVEAAIFILCISATPLYARMAEMSFRAVDKGLIEAVRAMGAKKSTIIREVLIPESLPSLVTGFTVTIITIIAFTAIAGYMGGGGLGDVAYRYGAQRYYIEIMIPTVILLIALNMLIQYYGDKLARKLDKTNR